MTAVGIDVPHLFIGTSDRAFTRSPVIRSFASTSLSPVGNTNSAVRGAKAMSAVMASPVLPLARHSNHLPRTRGKRRKQSGAASSEHGVFSKDDVGVVIIQRNTAYVLDWCFFCINHICLDWPMRRRPCSDRVPFEASVLSVHPMKDASFSCDVPFPPSTHSVASGP